MIHIKSEKLTADAFAPFGDVIELEGKHAKTINDGFARRFDRLAKIDVTSEGGEINVSLFMAKRRQLPLKISMMERHPLGSQLFYPLQEEFWLVLVCADPQSPTSFRAFTATGLQGVNFARNTWHFPLIVLNDASRFMVIDRAGPGNNLEEAGLTVPMVLEI